jgi:hypothetical protein
MGSLGTAARNIRNQGRELRSGKRGSTSTGSPGTVRSEIKVGIRQGNDKGNGHDKRSDKRGADTYKRSSF